MTRNPMDDAAYVNGPRNARGGQTYEIRQQRDDLKALVRELRGHVKYLYGYFAEYHAIDHPDCLETDELLARSAEPGDKK